MYKRQDNGRIKAITRLKLSVGFDLLGNGGRVLADNTCDSGFREPAAVRVLPDAAVAGDRLGVVDAADGFDAFREASVEAVGFNGCLLYTSRCV